MFLIGEVCNQGGKCFMENSAHRNKPVRRGLVLPPSPETYSAGPISQGKVMTFSTKWFLLFLATFLGALRNFLPVFLVLCVLASVSCGGGTDSGSPPPNGAPHPPSRCDLASQEAEQRAYERDEYFPKRYSRDFSRDLGADISPTDYDYDLARKVSRSVFDVELRERDSGLMKETGTGWLIAPRYVATAAHNVTEQIGPLGQGRCEKITNRTVHVHTFDGDTINAEVVWFDKKCVAGTDLALLKLEREIDAVPMKIADERPGRNEMLMAMGGSGNVNVLGSWNVTAGPALELRSGQTVPGLSVGRVYQWVPTGSGGMSGGPIFNRRGEVVSIVSTGRSYDNTDELFGIRSSQKPVSPPENLWVYGFIQKFPSDFSFGPNPDELRDLYNKDPGLSEPANAGDYRNSNEWERTDHPLDDHYSPFPVDQFDRMNGVYKEARKGTVTVKAGFLLSGSGFIYDDSTVITVAHVVRELGSGADIRTIDGRSHRATVSKTQNDNDCDIAILKTEEPGALSRYTKLELGDSSSLRCGDPLVQIGSGGAYNAAGELQGLGAVYMTTKEYTSNLLSRSVTSGMSGGPVVDRDGRVVAISSGGLADLRDEWDRPAPLYIHTRFPVYQRQDRFEGQNPETIKKFIEQSDFYCRR
jgi:S1-C subfamily serine protease